MSETFFGSTKEFSSITLEEVNTVFVDPDNRELSPNPSIETLRFTLLFPKFTIWKIHFPESKNLAGKNQTETLTTRFYVCLCFVVSQRQHVMLGRPLKLTRWIMPYLLNCKKDSNLQHWQKKKRDKNLKLVFRARSLQTMLVLAYLYFQVSLNFAK